MGKRSGVTKSGRVMNPADRERKQMRQKELKRNKKQRIMVRNAIVKSRNPENLVEQLRRMDDQEFDPIRELSLNVISEKRSKIRGAFIQIISLYRQEKDDKKVKSLEKMLHEYEIERFKKEQNFKAKEFSDTADPNEIPLPTGSMGPDSAKTPSFAVPIPPVVPQIATKGGILKKPTQPQVIGPAPPIKKHKYPPGPPSGFPPKLSSDSDDDGESDEEFDRSSRKRRVRFTDDRQKDHEGHNDDDDDYAPVEIPESMMVEQPDQMQTRPSLYPQGPIVGGPFLSGPPRYPPGMVHSIPPQQRMGPSPYPPGFRIPPNIPPELHAQMLRTGRIPAHMGRQNVSNTEEPHPSAVIIAPPQVVKPSVDSAQSTIISAEPQMRNLKREATRFVPSTLRVPRPQPTSIGPKIPSIAAPGTQIIPKKKKLNRQTGKSVDEACDEFLKEIGGLL